MSIAMELQVHLLVKSFQDCGDRHFAWTYLFSTIQLASTYGVLGKDARLQSSVWWWRKDEVVSVPKQHSMKTYWGRGCTAQRFPNLGITWRWVASFTPRPLYPRDKSPHTHSIWGWMGPRTGRNTVAKRINPNLCWKWKSIVHLVA